MTILIMLGTFAMAAVSFYVGFIFGKRERRTEEPSEQERRQAEHLHNEFQKLMSFNLDVARGGIKNV